MRKMFFVLFTALLTTLSLQAQDSPVKWSFEAQQVSEQEYVVVATADIQEGWAVYSQDMKEGSGPIATQFVVEGNDQLSILGAVKEIGRKKTEYDPLFDAELVKLSGKTSFRQLVKVENGVDEIRGLVTFMTCCEDSCMPPTDVAFVVAID